MQNMTFMNCYNMSEPSCDTWEAGGIVLLVPEVLLLIYNSGQIITK